MSQIINPQTEKRLGFIPVFSLRLLNPFWNASSLLYVQYLALSAYKQIVRHK